MPALRIACEVTLDLVRLVWESASYALAFVSARLRSRAKLAAEIVALRSQVAACRDRVDCHDGPHFTVAYVFVVSEHMRRRVIHLATTRGPTMEWVIQQLRNAMPFGSQPRYLFRDNDGIYGHGVALFLKSCGIREVRTALQSPWQSPYIERFIGTLRRELLNHVIVLNQHHLERLLREFIEEHYHVARPHQGLNGDTPIPTESPPDIDGPTTLVTIPVLGGLHHRYLRAAA